MSDGDALMAAIIAHPAEDTPRLMYADWLDEHGQEQRAEFIRVQVELARLVAAEPPECADPMYRAGFRSRLHHEHHALKVFLGDESPCRCAQCLNSTQMGLFAQCVASVPRHEGWYPELPGWAILPLTNWSRGFVESLACNAADWLEWGDVICQSQPVTRVRFGSLWREGLFRRRHGSEVWVRSLDEFLRLVCDEWPRIAFEFFYGGHTIDSTLLVRAGDVRSAITASGVRVGHRHPGALTPNFVATNIDAVPLEDGVWRVVITYRPHVSVGPAAPV